MATYSNTFTYNIDVPEPDTTMSTNISLDCTEGELIKVNKCLAEAKQAIREGKHKSSSFYPLDQMQSGKMFFEKTDGHIRIERHSQDEAADIIPLISYIKRVVPSVVMRGKMYTINPYFGNRMIWRIHGPKGSEALEVESTWGPVAPGDTDVPKPVITKSPKPADKTSERSQSFEIPAEMAGEASNRRKYSSSISFNAKSSSAVVTKTKPVLSRTEQDEVEPKAESKAKRTGGWKSGSAGAQKKIESGKGETHTRQNASSNAGKKKPAAANSSGPATKAETSQKAKTTGWRSATASSVESPSSAASSSMHSSDRDSKAQSATSKSSRPKQQGWKSGTANPDDSSTSSSIPKPKTTSDSGSQDSDYPTTQPSAPSYRKSGYNSSPHKSKTSGASPIVWWITIPGIVGFIGELFFSGFNIGVSLLAAIVFAFCGGIAYALDKSKKKR